MIKLSPTVRAYLDARCALRKASDRYSREEANKQYRAVRRLYAMSPESEWPTLTKAKAFLDWRLDLNDGAQAAIDFEMSES